MYSSSRRRCSSPTLSRSSSFSSVGKGSAAGSTSSQKNGDYQLLHSSLQSDRQAVQRARSRLASTLISLGEHHVRKREYNEAMEVFNEALIEQRNLFSDSLPTRNPDLRGSYAMSSCSTLSQSASSIDDVDSHKRLDDMISTLSNIGNVHSLRGEQSEAMKYYAEVMSIRASRSNLPSPDAKSTSASGSGSSALSGISMWSEEDNSLITELNEDVKALDDMFRSIAFRNGDMRGVGVDAKEIEQDMHCTAGERRIRRRRGRQQNELPPIYKSKQEKYNENGDLGMSSPTKTESKAATNTSENLSDAIEMYRSVLDTYTGQHLETHEKEHLAYLDRIKLLCESSDESREDTEQTDLLSRREEELHLALEIYDSVLSAQRDMVSSSSPLPPTTESDISAMDRSQQASVNVASTLITMGGLHYKLNHVEDELRMYKQAKTVYAEALGEQHPYVAGTRKNIGMVLAERGEYDAAMSEFKMAHNIYTSVNNGQDSSSRDVASALSCMGNVQNRKGDLDDALNYYGDALGIYKWIQSQGGQSEKEIRVAVEDVTSTLKIIGMVHAKRGDLDQAMECFQEAMDLLRSLSSKMNVKGPIGSGSILARIAGILYKKGQYDEAMCHYEEAYDVTTQELGTTNHPDIAGLLHYIGGIHHKRGKFVDAMACYKDAVRIYRNTLGADNPAVATTLVCIGNIHFRKKNLDKAMYYYDEALRINRVAYGPHHPDVAPTLKSIGMIHTKKGEYDDALDVFRDVLQIKCAVHGTNHPDVASAYKSLGNVQFKKGELADAERQYKHALSIYKQSLGESHHDTITVRKSINLIRESMRQRGENTRSKSRLRRSSSRSRSSRVQLMPPQS